jgi:hypothetical protein
MDLSNITISSLTSEPEDLTVIRAQSGLPTEHNSRHTDDGFWIDPKRLPNCVPLPVTKKPRASWVWDQGHAIGVQKDRDVTRFWLCKKCYNAGTEPRSSYLIRAPGGTTKVIDHLEKSHSFDREGNQKALRRGVSQTIYNTCGAGSSECTTPYSTRRGGSKPT